MCSLVIHICPPLLLLHSPGTRRVDFRLFRCFCPHSSPCPRPTCKISVSLICPLFTTCRELPPLFVGDRQEEGRHSGDVHAGGARQFHKEHGSLRELLPLPPFQEFSGKSPQIFSIKSPNNVFNLSTKTAWSRVVCACDPPFTDAASYAVCVLGFYSHSTSRRRISENWTIF